MRQAQKLLYSKSVTSHLITVVYTIKGIFRKEEMHIVINIANENQQAFPPHLLFNDCSQETPYPSFSGQKPHLCSITRSFK